MKKILITALILVLVGGLAFTGYKFFLSRSTRRGPEPGIGAATLCDAVKHSCGEYSKTSDAGSLKVVLFGKGTIGGIEVDVGSRPGATQYYMKFSDSSGVALLEGLPDGNYSVYFNGNNFPKEYGDTPTQQVQIVKGETKVVEIHLGR